MGGAAGSRIQGTASYLLEIGAMALDRLRVPGFGDRLATLWRTTMLARGIDPDVDLDDPLALPAPQQYHLQNYAAFLAATAESDADLRRALAAQRACVRVRDQVTHGELAVYGAKFTSARTSRQAAAAIAGRLLAALGAVRGTGTAEYRDVLAEGVAHARAAIENPTTAVLLGDVRVDGSADGRDGPEVARLAIAVLPVIVAAWERQRDSIDGSGVLVDDDAARRRRHAARRYDGRERWPWRRSARSRPGRPRGPAPPPQRADPRRLAGPHPGYGRENQIGQPCRSQASTSDCPAKYRLASRPSDCGFSSPARAASSNSPSSQPA